MIDDLWPIPTLLLIIGLGYASYAIGTRGFKGAMFGHKIAASTDRVVEYRHRQVKHTIRLHMLDNDDLFGLEIGRWTGILGETTAVVVPREQLLLLRDMISEFVPEN